jgi:hypothetical protein
MKNRIIQFTNDGVLFHYNCFFPLCTFTAQHFMRFDELAVHMNVYKTTQKQAIRHNRRFFIGKYKQHEHKIWAYEI